MGVTITFQAGSQVEGLTIDEEFRQYIWPGVSDEQFVTALRELFRDDLKAKVRARIQGDITNQVNQYVEDHTSTAS